MERTRSVWKTVGSSTLLVLALILCAIGPAPGHAEPPRQYGLADLKALQDAFVKLAEEVRPSVVAIRTYTVHNTRDPAASPIKIPDNQGSGFVIDRDGYIATNHHVIEGADAISVILHTGQRYDATVRQTDRRSDLAVLKIDAKGLKPVRWGDQSRVQVGQWTFACGNPFGLANRDGHTSVTMGVVSALDRDMTRRLEANPQRYYYGNLIETSAAINPGGSGGPLFNIDGEVIGVVTAIETSSGINEGAGFAIPINENSRRIIEVLKAGHVVRYGFMGVSVEDVPPPQSRRVADTRAHAGARIITVSPPDGPAGKAGLQPGDVLIKVDDAAIEDSDHLVRLIQYAPVGTEVEITYLRKRVKRKTTVTLADRDELLGITRRE